MIQNYRATRCKSQVGPEMTASSPEVQDFKWIYCRIYGLNHNWTRYPWMLHSERYQNTAWWVLRESNFRIMFSCSHSSHYWDKYRVNRSYESVGRIAHGRQIPNGVLNVKWRSACQPIQVTINKKIAPNDKNPRNNLHSHKSCSLTWDSVIEIERNYEQIEKVGSQPSRAEKTFRNAGNRPQAFNSRCVHFYGIVL